MIRPLHIRTTEIPSSSMADIAFLLLIFFLLTATLSMDIGIPLKLPDGDPLPIPRDHLSSIQLNQRGDIMVNEKSMTLDDLYQYVIREQSNNPREVFTIQTHPLTKYKKYIEVLDQLKRAQARKISILDPAY